MVRNLRVRVWSTSNPLENRTVARLKWLFYQPKRQSSPQTGHCNLCRPDRMEQYRSGCRDPQDNELSPDFPGIPEFHVFRTHVGRCRRQQDIAIALRAHYHHFPYRQACARLGVVKRKPIPPAAPRKLAKNDLLVLFTSFSSCRAIQIYRQEGHFCALRPFRVALLQCHEIWPRVVPRHRARTLRALLRRDVSAGLSQQAVTCR
jgi:hypothetical protein